MNKKELKDTINELEESRDKVNWYGFEAFLVAAGFGFATSSWLLFLLILIALIVAIKNAKAIKIVGIIMTFLWTIVGFFVGSLFGTTAAFVVSFLFLLISLGFHQNMHKAQQDVL